MTAYWPEFIAIALAHLFAVASPGPDFAVVMRQCVTAGTRAGIWTALGVGTGIFLHVGYCLLGVALLLSSSQTLFAITKLIAAAYLFYLGIQAFRASLQEQPPTTDNSSEVSVRPWRAFGLGFLTNGLNPKATLFFLALFTVVIDPATPVTVQLVYGLYLGLATFAWFAGLSLLLGRQGVRSFLLRAGAWFERGMSLVLILLATRIVLSV